MNEKIKNLKTPTVNQKFNLCIKQCYVIVGSVEKLWKVKENPKQCFLQNVQCVIVKNQDL